MTQQFNFPVEKFHRLDTRRVLSPTALCIFQERLFCQQRVADVADLYRGNGRRVLAGERGVLKSKSKAPTRLPTLRQRAGAGVNGVLAKQLLDAQELVVFGQTVRAAQRAGLDLAAVRRHGDVSNGRVFGFARAMTDDGGVAVRLRELTASSVSVSEPIWFTFTRIELAVPVSMPF